MLYPSNPGACCACCAKAGRVSRHCRLGWALRSSVRASRVLALTATATRATEAAVLDVLRLPPSAVLRDSVVRPNLRLAVVRKPAGARRVAGGSPSGCAGLVPAYFELSSSSSSMLLLPNAAALDQAKAQHHSPGVPLPHPPASRRLRARHLGRHCGPLPPRGRRSSFSPCTKALPPLLQHGLAHQAALPSPLRLAFCWAPLRAPAPPHWQHSGWLRRQAGKAFKIPTPACRAGRAGGRALRHSVLRLQGRRRPPGAAAERARRARCALPCGAPPAGVWTGGAGRGLRGRAGGRAGLLF